MYKLYILPEALKDLDEIFDYTEELWSYDQAVKYFNLLDGCIVDIGNGKIEGRNYKHNSLPYKVVITGKHLIFYRIESKSCVIVRILHEKMNFEKIL